MKDQEQAFVLKDMDYDDDVVILAASMVYNPYEEVSGIDFISESEYGRGCNYQRYLYIEQMRY